MTWCETTAKIISHKSTHTHWIKELPLPVSHWHRKSQTAPLIKSQNHARVSRTPHGDPMFRSSLCRYWIGICYLAGSSWQICFEYIIYPVLCSWFFISLFLMHQPPGQSSPPQAKLCLLGDYLHRSSTLLPLAWTPGLQFLVRTS